MNGRRPPVAGRGVTDGVMLAPGGGRRIAGGTLDATVKMTIDHPALTSSFEIVVAPGWDVGAHVHAEGEEVFYVVEGELDILAFEPLDRSVPDWHAWESASGRRYLRGGPGSFMFVPPGVPHAFANLTDTAVRMFFQSSVAGGHENYFDDLVQLLRRTGGRPDPGEAAELRSRYGIEQITPIAGGPAPISPPAGAGR